MKTMKTKKVLSAILCICLAALLSIVPAFADNELVKGGATWILDGLFWVGVVVVAYVLIKLALAKNITGAVVTIIVGAIVLTIIRAPAILTDLGNIFKDVLGLGSGS